MLLGLLLFPAVFRFVLQMWECFLSKAPSQSRTYNEIWRSLIFFSSLGFIMIVIIPTWMEFVQDFHMHPLLWYCLSTLVAFCYIEFYVVAIGLYLVAITVTHIQLVVLILHFISFCCPYFNLYVICDLELKLYPVVILLLWIPIICITTCRIIYHYALGCKSMSTSVCFKHTGSDWLENVGMELTLW